MVPPELAGSLSTFWSMLEMCSLGTRESCSRGGVLLEVLCTKLPGNMRLLVTECCGLPCKTLVLEKAMCTAGTGCQRSHSGCRSLSQETKPFLSALLLQHPLQANFNVMPTGKAKMFKGPRCIFREQIKRLNLELKSNKLIIVTVIF